jgi:hypothetical protein
MQCVILVIFIYIFGTVITYEWLGLAPASFTPARNVNEHFCTHSEHLLHAEYYCRQCKGDGRLHPITSHEDPEKE